MKAADERRDSPRTSASHALKQQLAQVRRAAAAVQGCQSTHHNHSKSAHHQNPLWNASPPGRLCTDDFCHAFGFVWPSGQSAVCDLSGEDGSPVSPATILATTFMLHNFSATSSLKSPDSLSLCLRLRYPNCSADLSAPEHIVGLFCCPVMRWIPNSCTQSGSCMITSPVPDVLETRWHLFLD